jgi:hypothetical protein
LPPQHRWSHTGKCNPQSPKMAKSFRHSGGRGATNMATSWCPQGANRRSQKWVCQQSNPLLRSCQMVLHLHEKQVYHRFCVVCGLKL